MQYNKNIIIIDNNVSLHCHWISLFNELFLYDMIDT